MIPDTFKPTHVALFSGGVDSGVMIHKLLVEQRDATVLGLAVDYGQRHGPAEANSQRALTAYFRAAFPGRFHRHTVTLDDLPLKSALVGNSGHLPAGHPDDPVQRATVVPGRNLLMLSLAAAAAESLGAAHVLYGAHKGDRVIYPDCRPGFVTALVRTWEEMESPVKLWTPLINHTKTGVVKLGLGLQFPFALAWTCYRGGTTACGVCGSCQERLAAFAANGVGDPLTYESREIFPPTT